MLNVAGPREAAATTSRRGARVQATVEGCKDDMSWADVEKFMADNL